jgi:hypothetical protein
MSHDFDAPRSVDVLDDHEAGALAVIRAQVRQRAGAAADEAAESLVESFLLAGADLDDVTLTVAVVPQQSYEFRCERCFLVLHRSLRAATSSGSCRDCA